MGGRVQVKAEQTQDGSSKSEKKMPQLRTLPTHACLSPHLDKKRAAANLWQSLLFLLPLSSLPSPPTGPPSAVVLLSHCSGIREAGQMDATASHPSHSRIPVPPPRQEASGRKPLAVPPLPPSSLLSTLTSNGAPVSSGVAVSLQRHTRSRSDGVATAAASGALPRLRRRSSMPGSTALAPISSSSSSSSSPSPASLHTATNASITPSSSSSSSSGEGGGKALYLPRLTGAMVVGRW
mmetsp:Transcript_26373/g.67252  ORF Transcript_26373/g.67252 Transcript_26373/m.67252 type:complete len:237 (+) Transcript_26373:1162-1872(+)